MTFILTHPQVAGVAFTTLHFFVSIPGTTSSPRKHHFVPFNSSISSLVQPFLLSLFTHPSLHSSGPFLDQYSFVFTKLLANSLFRPSLLETGPVLPLQLLLFTLANTRSDHALSSPLRKTGMEQLFFEWRAMNDVGLHAEDCVVELIELSKRWLNQNPSDPQTENIQNSFQMRLLDAESQPQQAAACLYSLDTDKIRNAFALFPHHTPTTHNTLANSLFDMTWFFHAADAELIQPRSSRGPKSQNEFRADALYFHRTIDMKLREFAGLLSSFTFTRPLSETHPIPVAPTIAREKGLSRPSESDSHHLTVMGIPVAFNRRVLEEMLSLIVECDVRWGWTNNISIDEIVSQTQYPHRTIPTKKEQSERAMFHDLDDVPLSHVFCYLFTLTSMTTDEVSHSIILGTLSKVFTSACQNAHEILSTARTTSREKGEILRSAIREEHESYDLYLPTTEQPVSLHHKHLVDVYSNTFDLASLLSSDQFSKLENFLTQIDQILFLLNDPTILNRMLIELQPSSEMWWEPPYLSKRDPVNDHLLKRDPTPIFLQHSEWSYTIPALQYSPFPRGMAPGANDQPGEKPLPFDPTAPVPTLLHRLAQIRPDSLNWILILLRPLLPHLQWHQTLHSLHSSLDTFLFINSNDAPSLALSQGQILQVESTHRLTQQTTWVSHLAQGILCFSEQLLFNISSIMNFGISPIGTELSVRIYATQETTTSSPPPETTQSFSTIKAVPPTTYTKSLGTLITSLFLEMCLFSESPMQSPLRCLIDKLEEPDNAAYTALWSAYLTPVIITMNRVLFLSSSYCHNPASITSFSSKHPEKLSQTDTFMLGSAPFTNIFLLMCFLDGMGGTVMGLLGEWAIKNRISRENVQHEPNIQVEQQLPSGSSPFWKAAHSILIPCGFIGVPDLLDDKSMTELLDYGECEPQISELEQIEKVDVVTRFSVTFMSQYYLTTIIQNMNPLNLFDPDIVKLMMPKTSQMSVVEALGETWRQVEITSDAYPSVPLQVHQLRAAQVIQFILRPFFAQGLINDEENNWMFGQNQGLLTFLSTFSTDQLMVVAKTQEVLKTFLLHAHNSLPEYFRPQEKGKKKKKTPKKPKRQLTKLVFDSDSFSDTFADGAIEDLIVAFRKTNQTTNLSDVYVLPDPRDALTPHESHSGITYTGEIITAEKDVSNSLEELLLLDTPVPIEYVHRDSFLGGQSDENQRPKRGIPFAGTAVHPEYLRDPPRTERPPEETNPFVSPRSALFNRQGGGPRNVHVMGSRLISQPEMPFRLNREENAHHHMSGHTILEERLQMMGATPTLARRAVVALGPQATIDSALDWIYAHGEETPESQTSSEAPTQPQVENGAPAAESHEEQSVPEETSQQAQPSTEPGNQANPSAASENPLQSPPTMLIDRDEDLTSLPVNSPAPEALLPSVGEIAHAFGELVPTNSSIVTLNIPFQDQRQTSSQFLALTHGPNMTRWESIPHDHEFFPYSSVTSLFENEPSLSRRINASGYGNPSNSSANPDYTCFTDTVPMATPFKTFHNVSVPEPPIEAVPTLYSREGQLRPNPEMYAVFEPILNVPGGGTRDTLADEASTRRESLKVWLEENLESLIVPILEPKERMQKLILLHLYARTLTSLPEGTQRRFVSLLPLAPSLPLSTAVVDTLMHTANRFPDSLFKTATVVNQPSTWGQLARPHSQFLRQFPLLGTDPRTNRLFNMTVSLGTDTALAIHTVYPPELSLFRTFFNNILDLIELEIARLNEAFKDDGKQDPHGIILLDEALPICAHLLTLSNFILQYFTQFHDLMTHLDIRSRLVKIVKDGLLAGTDIVSFTTHLSATAWLHFQAIHETDPKDESLLIPTHFVAEKYADRPEWVRNPLHLECHPVSHGVGPSSFKFKHLPYSNGQALHLDLPTIHYTKLLLTPRYCYPHPYNHSSENVLDSEDEEYNTQRLNLLFKSERVCYPFHHIKREQAVFDTVSSITPFQTRSSSQSAQRYDVIDHSAIFLRYTLRMATTGLQQNIGFIGPLVELYRELLELEEMDSGPYSSLRHKNSDSTPLPQVDPALKAENNAEIFSAGIKLLDVVNKLPTNINFRVNLDKLKHLQRLSKQLAHYVMSVPSIHASTFNSLCNTLSTIANLTLNDSDILTQSNITFVQIADITKYVSVLPPQSIENFTHLFGLLLHDHKSFKSAIKSGIRRAFSTETIVNKLFTLYNVKNQTRLSELRADMTPLKVPELYNKAGAVPLSNARLFNQVVAEECEFVYIKKGPIHESSQGSEEDQRNRGMTPEKKTGRVSWSSVDEVIEQNGNDLIISPVRTNRADGRIEGSASLIPNEPGSNDLLFAQKSKIVPKENMTFVPAVNPLSTPEAASERPELWNEFDCRTACGIALVMDMLLSLVDEHQPTNDHVTLYNSLRGAGEEEGWSVIHRYLNDHTFHNTSQDYLAPLILQPTTRESVFFTLRLFRTLRNHHQSLLNGMIACLSTSRTENHFIRVLFSLIPHFPPLAPQKDSPSQVLMDILVSLFDSNDILRQQVINVTFDELRAAFIGILREEELLAEKPPRTTIAQSHSNPNDLSSIIAPSSQTVSIPRLMFYSIALVLRKYLMSSPLLTYETNESRMCTSLASVTTPYPFVSVEAIATILQSAPHALLLLKDMFTVLGLLETDSESEAKKDNLPRAIFNKTINLGLNAIIISIITAFEETQVTRWLEIRNDTPVAFTHILVQYRDTFEHYPFNLDVLNEHVGYGAPLELACGIQETFRAMKIERDAMENGEIRKGGFVPLIGEPDGMRDFSPPERAIEGEEANIQAKEQFLLSNIVPSVSLEFSMNIPNEPKKVNLSTFQIYPPDIPDRLIRINLNPPSVPTIPREILPSQFVQLKTCIGPNQETTKEEFPIFKSLGPVPPFAGTVPLSGVTLITMLASPSFSLPPSAFVKRTNDAFSGIGESCAPLIKHIFSTDEDALSSTTQNDEEPIDPLTITQPTMMITNSPHIMTTPTVKFFFEVFLDLHKAFHLHLDNISGPMTRSKADGDDIVELTMKHILSPERTYRYPSMMSKNEENSPIPHSTRLGYWVELTAAAMTKPCTYPFDRHSFHTVNFHPPYNTKIERFIPFRTSQSRKWNLTAADDAASRYLTGSSTFVWPYGVGQTETRHLWLIDPAISVPKDPQEESAFHRKEKKKSYIPLHRMKTAFQGTIGDLEEMTVWRDKLLRIDYALMLPTVESDLPYQDSDELEPWKQSTPLNAFLTSDRSAHLNMLNARDIHIIPIGSSALNQPPSLETTPPMLSPSSYSNHPFTAFVRALQFFFNTELLHRNHNLSVPPSSALNYPYSRPKQLFYTSGTDWRMKNHYASQRFARPEAELTELMVNYALLYGSLSSHSDHSSMLSSFERLKEKENSLYHSGRQRSTSPVYSESHPFPPQLEMTQIGRLNGSPFGMILARPSSSFGGTQMHGSTLLVRSPQLKQWFPTHKMILKHGFIDTTGEKLVFSPRDPNNTLNAVNCQEVRHGLSNIIYVIPQKPIRHESVPPAATHNSSPSSRPRSRSPRILPPQMGFNELQPMSRIPLRSQSNQDAGFFQAPILHRSGQNDSISGSTLLHHPYRLVRSGSGNQRTEEIFSLTYRPPTDPFIRRSHNQAMSMKSNQQNHNELRSENSPSTDSSGDPMRYFSHHLYQSSSTSQSQMPLNPTGYLSKENIQGALRANGQVMDPELIQFYMDVEWRRDRNNHLSSKTSRLREVKTPLSFTTTVTPTSPMMLESIPVNHSIQYAYTRALFQKLWKNEPSPFNYYFFQLKQLLSISIHESSQQDVLCDSLVQQIIDNYNWLMTNSAKVQEFSKCVEMRNLRRDRKSVPPRVGPQLPKNEPFVLHKEAEEVFECFKLFSSSVNFLQSVASQQPLLSLHLITENKGKIWTIFNGMTFSSPVDLFMCIFSDLLKDSGLVSIAQDMLHLLSVIIFSLATLPQNSVEMVQIRHAMLGQPQPDLSQTKIVKIQPFLPFGNQPTIFYRFFTSRAISPEVNYNPLPPFTFMKQLFSTFMLSLITPLPLTSVDGQTVINLAGVPHRRVMNPSHFMRLFGPLMRFDELLNIALNLILNQVESIVQQVLQRQTTFVEVLKWIPVVLTAFVNGPWRSKTDTPTSFKPTKPVLLEKLPFPIDVKVEDIKKLMSSLRRRNSDTIFIHPRILKTVSEQLVAKYQEIQRTEGNIDAFSDETLRDHTEQLMDFSLGSIDSGRLHGFPSPPSPFPRTGSRSQMHRPLNSRPIGSSDYMPRMQAFEPSHLRRRPSSEYISPLFGKDKKRKEDTPKQKEPSPKLQSKPLSMTDLSSSPDIAAKARDDKLVDILSTFPAPNLLPTAKPPIASFGRFVPRAKASSPHRQVLSEPQLDIQPVKKMKRSHHISPPPRMDSERGTLDPLNSTSAQDSDSSSDFTNLEDLQDTNLSGTGAQILDDLLRPPTFSMEESTGMRNAGLESQMERDDSSLYMGSFPIPSDLSLHTLGFEQFQDRTMDRLASDLLVPPEPTIRNINLSPESNTIGHLRSSFIMDDSDDDLSDDDDDLDGSTFRHWIFTDQYMIPGARFRETDSRDSRPSFLQFPSLSSKNRRDTVRQRQVFKDRCKTHLKQNGLGPGTHHVSHDALVIHKILAEEAPFTRDKSSQLTKNFSPFTELRNITLEHTRYGLELSTQDLDRSSWLPLRLFDVNGSLWSFLERGSPHHRSGISIKSTLAAQSQDPTEFNAQSIQVHHSHFSLLGRNRETEYMNDIVPTLETRRVTDTFWNCTSDASGNTCDDDQKRRSERESKIKEHETLIKQGMGVKQVHTASLSKCVWILPYMEYLETLTMKQNDFKAEQKPHIEKPRPLQEKKSETRWPLPVITMGGALISELMSLAIGLINERFFYQLFHRDVAKQSTQTELGDDQPIGFVDKNLKNFPEMMKRQKEKMLSAEEIIEFDKEHDLFVQLFFKQASSSISHLSPLLHSIATVFSLSAFRFIPHAERLLRELLPQQTEASRRFDAMFGSSSPSTFAIIGNSGVHEGMFFSGPDSSFFSEPNTPFQVRYTLPRPSVLRTSDANRAGRTQHQPRETMHPQQDHRPRFSIPPSEQVDNRMVSNVLLTSTQQSQNRAPQLANQLSPPQPPAVAQPRTSRAPAPPPVLPFPRHAAEGSPDSRPSASRSPVERRAEQQNRQIRNLLFLLDRFKRHSGDRLEDKVVDPRGTPTPRPSVGRSVSPSISTSPHTPRSINIIDKHLLFTHVVNPSESELDVELYSPEQLAVLDQMRQQLENAVLRPSEQNNPLSIFGYDSQNTQSLLVSQSFIFSSAIEQSSFGAPLGGSFDPGMDYVGNREDYRRQKKLNVVQKLLLKQVILNSFVDSYVIPTLPIFQAFLTTLEISAHNTFDLENLGEQHSSLDFFFNSSESFLRRQPIVPLEPLSSQYKFIPSTPSSFVDFGYSVAPFVNFVTKRDPPTLFPHSVFNSILSIPASISFSTKRDIYRRHSKTIMNSRARPKSIRLEIHRETCFQDTFQILKDRKTEDWFCQFTVQFKNEEGQDAGGVLKEFFIVVSQQLYGKAGLFQPCENQALMEPSRTFSGPTDELKEKYVFAGRLIGKALIENHLVDIHLSRPVLKQILRQPLSLLDLTGCEPSLLSSLTYMLQMDDFESVGMTFQIEEETETGLHPVDLIPNGADVPVTNENAEQFIQLWAEHKMTTSIAWQLEAFTSGLSSIAPINLLTIFDSFELEMLMCGMPNIDTVDLKAHVTYRDYTATSQPIIWFWEIVDEMTQEQLAHLVQFITGSSGVPIGGFKNLMTGKGAQRLIEIARVYQDDARLPSAHTCFNQLELPPYTSKDIMRQRLFLAIREGSEGFGFI
ncbi:hypothetical protein BLNAU_9411 [Blattamonas nauphoetae]|uniref:HECT-type E3 ubiquitin transferase n=1 Tax=Blattamonas nauphoetae TaxID=2049346 RepID=A0ABQ9XVQ4_9EUKA|nr:hypothetical protein BLNAU_9411 [Blattamonas nauphoetae]